MNFGIEAAGGCGHKLRSLACTSFEWRCRQPTIALNVDTSTIALADSGDILKSTKNSRWSNENVVSCETELIGTDYCSNAQPFERGAIRMGDWFEWVMAFECRRILKPK
jgi:hypothetical protein